IAGSARHRQAEGGRAGRAEVELERLADGAARFPAAEAEPVAIEIDEVPRLDAHAHLAARARLELGFGDDYEELAIARRVDARRDVGVERDLERRRVDGGEHGVAAVSDEDRERQGIVRLDVGRLVEDGPTEAGGEREERARFGEVLAGTEA